MSYDRILGERARSNGTEYLVKVHNKSLRGSEIFLRSNLMRLKGGRKLVFAFEKIERRKPCDFDSEVLGKVIAKKDNKHLVQWMGLPLTLATWESDLEDEIEVDPEMENLPSFDFQESQLSILYSEPTDSISISYIIKSLNSHKQATVYDVDYGSLEGPVLGLIRRMAPTESERGPILVITSNEFLHTWERAARSKYPLTHSIVSSIHDDDVLEYLGTSTSSVCPFSIIVTTQTIASKHMNHINKHKWMFVVNATESFQPLKINAVNTVNLVYINRDLFTLIEPVATPLVIQAKLTSYEKMVVRELVKRHKDELNINETKWFAESMKLMSLHPFCIRCIEEEYPSISVLDASSKLQEIHRLVNENRQQKILIITKSELFFEYLNESFSFQFEEEQECYRHINLQLRVIISKDKHLTDEWSDITVGVDCELPKSHNTGQIIKINSFDLSSARSLKKCVAESLCTSEFSGNVEYDTFWQEVCDIIDYVKFEVEQGNIKEPGCIDDCKIARLLKRFGTRRFDRIAKFKPSHFTEEDYIARAKSICKGFLNMFSPKDALLHKVLEDVVPITLTMPQWKAKDIYEGIFKMTLFTLSADAKLCMGAFKPSERGMQWWTRENDIELVEQVSNEGMCDSVIGSDGNIGKLVRKVPRDIMNKRLAEIANYFENSSIQNGLVSLLWLQSKTLTEVQIVNIFLDMSAVSNSLHTVVLPSSDINREDTYRLFCQNVEGFELNAKQRESSSKILKMLKERYSDSQVFEIISQLKPWVKLEKNAQFELFSLLYSEGFRNYRCVIEKATYLGFPNTTAKTLLRKERSLHKRIDALMLIIHKSAIQPSLPPPLHIKLHLTPPPQPQPQPQLEEPQASEQPTVEGNVRVEAPEMPKSDSTKYIDKSLEFKTRHPITILGSVIDYGHIVYDRLGFHTKRYIYPVGYKSTRVASSTEKPGTQETYLSEILDTDTESPLFRVSSLDNPSVSFTGNSPTTPWVTILRKASKLNNPDKKPPTCSGPEYFLLAHPTVCQVISQMPGFDQCRFHEGFACLNKKLDR